VIAAKPDILRPALIGGLIGGLLSVLPPFCCLNCCCCLNFVLAGVIAGGIYAKRAATINWLPQAGEGASVGVLAGFFAGLVNAIVEGIAGLLAWAVGDNLRCAARFRGPGPFDWDRIWRGSELWEGIPPAVIWTGDFAGSVILGAIFGALGGMLGILIFRRIPPAAPPAAGPGPSVGPGTGVDRGL